MFLVYITAEVVTIFYIYIMSQKQHTQLLVITLANVDQCSKLFQ